MGSKMGTDPLQNSGNSQGMGNRLHYTAEVDKEKCCCCELCIDMCPVEAITMEDIIVIDAARCTACGACINGCSSNAISLTKKVLL
jgi:ferredoxin